MKWILSILIALFLGSTAVAQKAVRPLFNPAAKEYIHGNTPVASNLVHQALRKFPESTELQKLKELIEQQQEQKDQQQQQDQQDQQDQKDQEDQKDQDNEDPSDSKDSDEQKDSEPEKPDEPDQEDPQEQPTSAPPRKAGEMTEEEAQQLLDAMKQNEKDQRADLRPYLGQPVRVDKDW